MGDRSRHGSGGGRAAHVRELHEPMVRFQLCGAAALALDQQAGEQDRLKQEEQTKDNHLPVIWIAHGRLTE